MLTLFLALALTAPGKAEKPHACVIQNIAACDNFYDSTWHSIMKRSLRRFFGRAKGKLVRIDSPLLSDQMFAAFTSVDVAGRPRRLRDGTYFVDGCLAHFCTQEAAAIMSRDGRLLALAFHSHQAGDLTRDLDIFIARRGEHNRPWIRELARWAVVSRVHSRGMRRLRFHVLNEIGDGHLPP
jgi:hypothetical protein